MADTIKKAVAYSTVMQLVTKGLAFAAIIVYARLLTPTELGIFAIASSIVILSTEFRTMGTNTYILRAESISDNDVRRCLAVSMLISWTLAILLIVFSVSVSTFFAHNDLAPLLQIFGASFLFAPFASIATAVLSKRIKFKAIMLIALVAQTSGLILSLTMLLLGFSYFSMAWGIFLTNAIEMLLSVILVKQSNLFIPCFDKLKHILKFGAISSSISLLRKSESIMPDLIIGKIGTAAHVAIISRAIGTHNFIVEAIFQGAKNVVLPYFSSISKENTRQLMDTLKKATEMTMLIALPTLTFSFIHMDTIVEVLFGDQWGDSIPIARMLAGWMLCKLTFYHFDSVLYIQKREKQILGRQLGSVILLSVSIFYLYSEALTYVGYAFVAMGIYEFIYNAYLLKKTPYASLRAYLKTLKLPILCSFILFSLNSILILVLSNIVQIITFTLSALLTFIVWLLFIKITDNSLSKELFIEKV